MDRPSYLKFDETGTIVTNCDKSVKHVKIPEGVISIEDLAFNGCTGLTSIEIPNSVISIGDWAFICCN